MAFRFLLIVVSATANLFGWQQVPEGNKARTTAGTARSGNANRNIPPTHVGIDEPYPIIATKPESPADHDNPTEKSRPWFVEIFTKPEWVIVDVTAVYVLVAWFTLVAIKRQADTMETQATEARESAAKATDLARQAADAATLA